MYNRDNRRLDVFGAPVVSRRHRVLCDLGLTFHYLRRSSGNRGSLVSNTNSGGNTFQVLLRPLRRLENLPSIHLEFEELGLDKRQLDKQEVEQLEVDRFDLD
ncbi:hypothetical protein Tco_0217952 [Tanacetum coccineum]